LTWPDLTQFGNIDVWRLALTLAVVASIETLLSLEAVEQMDPKKEPALPDRELRAQGIGNLLAGMLGALPLTAVIVRSTANLHAGAQTKASALIHGVLLLVSVFFLAPVLNLIPLASLAAILIATGLKLAKPSLLKEAAQGGIGKLMPFLVTVVGVLSIDLLAGVAMGLACCGILALRASLKQALSFERQGDAFVVRFSRHVPSFTKGELKEKLGQLPDHATVIIDDSHTQVLDADVRECITEFVGRSAHRGIVVRWRREAGEDRHSTAARPVRDGWHPPSAGEALARNHRLAR
jgi:MFS superfamily sulfate permease-like transporter